MSKPSSGDVDDGGAASSTAALSDRVDGGRDPKRLRVISSLPVCIGGRYKVLAQLGSGSFGDVYRAKDTRSGNVVAVKCLRRENDDPDGRYLQRELAGEVRALEACRGDPHVVQIVDYGGHPDAKTWPEAPFIVMEYVGASLQDAILRRGGSPSARRYAECEVRPIMRQLLSGVKRMNEAGFMHRDIKPDNVLVDEHGNVKICDLGFARTKAGSPPPFSNPVAALLYRAPEVLLESTTYDETVDTWALGCLMALLLAGNPLFYGKTEVEMLRAILDVLGMDDLTRWRGYANCMIKKSKMRFVRRDSRLREMFPIPGMIGGGGRRPELSPAGFEVLKRLLSCNPERRMTAAEALEQRWFES